MSKVNNYSKSDARYWKSRLYRNTYTENGLKRKVEEYSIKMQWRGKRVNFPLGSKNKEVASRKAAEIYNNVRSTGWDEALRIYKPEYFKNETPTIGEFLEAVREYSQISKRSLPGYENRFRQILADIFKVNSNSNKHDYVNGGRNEWVEKIHKIKLDQITQEKIIKWKSDYIRKRANGDPRKESSAKVSLNTVLRNAKALFSKRKVLPFIREKISLPEKLPFDEVLFEKEPDRRYRSRMDPKQLLILAKEDLMVKEPEVFKIIVLALLCGLRREEIDLLEWNQFDFISRTLEIRPTRYFMPKSESSCGIVKLDPGMANIFQNYYNITKGRFVVEGSQKPTKGDYRGDKLFDRACDWLRKNGVTDQKPLHTLRKEYGRLLTESYGIYAASLALRHANTQVTQQYYADDTRQFTTGLDSFL